MPESLTLGTVDVDYVSQAEFTALCERWLTSSELHHIVTLNPEMVMQAEDDQSFREALKHATVRVPDGSGLIWARWYLRSQFWALLPSLLAFPFVDVERVTGVDAVVQLAELCHRLKRSVYLLGGTPTQVEATQAFLQKKFPGLVVHTSPAHTASLEGPPAILKKIQEAQPAALLVAYGAPLQTVWIEQHRRQLAGIGVAMGVGGAFAMLSEQSPRAPQWLRRLNLEWLWRLILEPSRIRRIWRATVEFPRRIHQQKQTVAK